jgi:hypothetical protein
MSKTSHLIHDPIPVPPRGEEIPAEIAPAADGIDILNDEVMIEVAPDRPCGTIRVRLEAVGRSTPIPADDPLAD